MLCIFVNATIASDSGEIAVSGVFVGGALRRHRPSRCMWMPESRAVRR
ncbi:MAG: hypothetical protein ACRC2T_18805 [Thermoguttaceae bacterium]